MKVYAATAAGVLRFKRLAHPHPWRTTGLQRPFIEALAITETEYAYTMQSQPIKWLRMTFEIICVRETSLRAATSSWPRSPDRSALGRGEPVAAGSSTSPSPTSSSSNVVISPCLKLRLVVGWWTCEREHLYEELQKGQLRTTRLARCWLSGPPW